MTIRSMAAGAETGKPIYDTIGRTYTSFRRSDPRIAAAIDSALGDAASVVNVGAGTGSYEPADRTVVAVEPSAVMLAQRTADAAPAVCGIAEALPFRNAQFDAALTVLSVHHWRDQARGLAECRRVTRGRVVLLTWDPEADGFWLTRDYFPEILARDAVVFPRMDAIAAMMGGADVLPLPVPADCIDGFMGAYWRRPVAYLDGAIRAGISSLAMVADDDSRIARLRADLDSGAWAARNGALLDLPELDLGYRLVIGRRA